MSRKAKIINVGGIGEVTVKEVSPFAVYKALSAEDKYQEVCALLEDCCSLSVEELKKLYPSQLQQIVAGFKEVNSSFFAMAEMLGLKTEVVQVILEKLATISQQWFAGLYKMVITRLGTTAGPSTLPPSAN